MVVMFENMSYAEIQQEPTFKKLVEYTGNSLNQNGHLLKLAHTMPKHDTNGNGYALFSSYYNNHSGGTAPTRPSQPNYIALTSGSIHNITDNEIHDLNVDNLASELNEAKITWKVYAEDLPDPKAPLLANIAIKNSQNQLPPKITAFVRDPKKSEAENDAAEHAHFEAIKKTYHVFDAKTGFSSTSGCFTAQGYDGSKSEDDGYKRKHEPFISYLDIQTHYEFCKNIVNASHLEDDINKLPAVTFYIPNQINDGHNGELPERVVNANLFLSKMMGTDPKTGEPLPNAANAPFQKFMAQDGLLILTFDEPSVDGNPDKTIYTLFAGKMINSGVYPDMQGKNLPICYPATKLQASSSKDKHGLYDPKQCNHYNLLKMIEANWQLRGLNSKDTSAGYQHAFALDQSIPGLWKG